jgi:hypothetical protein
MVQEGVTKFMEQQYLLIDVAAPGPTLIGIFDLHAGRVCSGVAAKARWISFLDKRDLEFANVDVDTSKYTFCNKTINEPEELLRIFPQVVFVIAGE